MVSGFIYIRSDGDKYRGYWKDEKQHGEGEEYIRTFLRSYKWIKRIWDNGRKVIS
jgi:hypothetical protein